VCESAVAMAWRETRGRASLTHTRGRDEHGVGLYAHAPRYWAWLVDGDLAQFCSPITGTLAIMREYQFAIEGGAESVRDLQHVHAGRRATSDHPVGDGRWCHLIGRSGVSCHTPISCVDLGGCWRAGRGARRR